MLRLFLCSVAVTRGLRARAGRSGRRGAGDLVRREWAWCVLPTSTHSECSIGRRRHWRTERGCQLGNATRVDEATQASHHRASTRLMRCGAELGSRVAPGQCRDYLPLPSFGLLCAGGGVVAAALWWQSLLRVSSFLTKPMWRCRPDSWECADYCGRCLGRRTPCLGVAVAALVCRRCCFLFRAHPLVLLAGAVRGGTISYATEWVSGSWSDGRAACSPRIWLRQSCALRTRAWAGMTSCYAQAR